MSILFGGLAAIGVIFVFMLDWRSTFISALALPTSVITTFFGLYLAGFTLNMMTLMGLSLAIGFLIDDAIVVRENIFRHIEAGEDPVTAASRGTKEIALAVIATTSSILAVFIPVAFASGMIGMMFKQFALTVAMAVTISLFVAFTLDPMLSARLVKPREEHEAPPSGITGFIKRTLDGFDASYRSVLAWSLRHRFTVVVVATLIFVSSLGSVALMGSEFVPKSDRGQIQVSVMLPAGTALDRTTAAVDALEKIVLADPDARQVYATVGVGEEARKAALRITMNDKSERSRTLDQVMDDLRGKFAVVPMIKYSFQVAGLIEGDSDLRQMPITVNVRGPKFDVLEPLAQKVGAIIQHTPGIVDQDSTWAPGLPELRIVPDRDAAAKAGVSAGMVGMAVRSAMVGDTPTRFRDGESDWGVRVRLRAQDRNDRDTLAGLVIPTLRGPVALRQIASIEDSTGPSTIEREDRQRQVTITANTLGRSVGEVSAEIQAAIDALPKAEKPDGYTVAFGGETKQMRESAQAFGVALALAIVFSYVVLASQFESFIHPITIMVSLPLAIVGALLGLFLAGKSFGMSAFIGIILLMGLVTKNAILVVDLTNQLRDEHGYDVMTALLEAGPRRLRPILMTTAAMVLGMLPSALSTGAGSEFRSPMSISVIGGVITSTGLTLVVVPVLYTFLDRFTARSRRERETAAAAPVAPPADVEAAEVA